MFRRDCGRDFQAHTNQNPRAEARLHLPSSSPRLPSYYHRVQHSIRQSKWREGSLSTSHLSLQTSRSAHFFGRFNQKVLIDLTPMPDHIPKVEEIGASSAPLMSASYFIGARCRPYNDDYMQCKTEAYGRGELECMKEGRKVTRCAASMYASLSRLIRPALIRSQTERHKRKLLGTVPKTLAMS